MSALPTVEIVVNDEEWLNMGARLEGAPDRIARRWVSEGLPILGQNMRSNIPRKTGGTVSSVEDVIIDPYHGRTQTTNGIGLFVDQPTRPHYIYPRNRKSLKFTIGGRTRFASRVFHPGTKGAQFRYKTLIGSAGQLTDLLRRSTAEEVGP